MVVSGCAWDRPDRLSSSVIASSLNSPAAYTGVAPPGGCTGEASLQCQLAPVCCTRLDVAAGKGAEDRLEAVDDVED